MRVFFLFVILFIASITVKADILPVKPSAKDTISDKDIILPESLENDVDSLFSNWYLKKYAIIDENCISTSVNIDYPDSVYIQRLANMPTIIEMPFNQIVKTYINFYTQKRRKLVEVMMGLGNYYFPIFEQELERQGLPLELKYLPIIESALRPEATSRAGAAGLWQFMIGTAKVLGMEVNSLVDERRDPLKSSEMAARYLKELYNIYHDWGLAIAAYNCGPGNVNKAIRRSGGKDYWEIYNYLPRETRGYLPAFIAANYVMRYYSDHNICPVLSDMPLTTDTIHINEQVHLQQIADVLQIPVDQLRSLNPQYRRDIVPGNAKTRTLILPSQQVYAFIEQKDSILQYRPDLYARRTTVDPSGYNSVSGYTYHKVRRGESLSTIAHKYGVSVKQLRKWNNLRSNTINTGKRLRVSTPLLASRETKPVVKTKPIAKNEVATVVDSSKTVVVNAAEARDEKVLSDNNPVTRQKTVSTLYHRIKPGESLSVIADKYGVSVSRLKSWNGLKSNNIRAGKSLKIQKTKYIDVPVKEENESQQLMADAKKEGNKVETIENSSAEAKNEKLEKEEVLARKNTGKTETSVTGAEKYLYHKVTRGESLWTISRRFPGVTSELIIKLNNLEDASLKVGQVLKIPVV